MSLILETTCLLIASLVVHEMGHIIYFKTVLNRDVWPRLYKEKKKGRNHYGLQLGTQSDYCDIPPEKLIWVYVSGVFAGLLPLFVLATIRPGWHNLLFLGVYLYYSRADIHNIGKCL